MPAGRFSEVHGRSREEIIADVMNDRFPPYILYQIIYTGDAPDRVRFTLVTVHLDGANVPLSFNCRIREGNDHVSVYAVVTTVAKLDVKHVCVCVRV